MNSPGQQYYVHQVNELYAVYKPEHANNVSAEAMVNSWPPGREEQHLLALKAKYGWRQPAPVSAQTTQSPSTAVSHSSPEKQHYVHKVKELFAVYKPEHANNVSAEMLVNTWPPGTEEERLRALYQKYTSRQPAPASERLLAVKQKYASSPAPVSAQTTQSPSTAVSHSSPEKQHYVHKVKELFAVYKPEHANNVSAEMLVNTWPPGREEERLRALYQKYTSRQPAPASERLLALKAKYGWRQPAPVSAQTTQSPSTAVSHSSPEKQYYVHKVKELFAVYKPEHANNVSAEMLVNTWPPGTEEERLRALYQKYTSRQPAPASERLLALKAKYTSRQPAPASERLLAVKQKYASSPAPVSAQTTQSSSTAVSHSSPRKQHYVHQVKELFAAYNPERVNDGSAEAVVNNWPPGREEQHLLALKAKYGWRQPAPVSAQTTQSPSTAVSHSSPEKQYYVHKVKELFAAYNPERVNDGSAEVLVNSWPPGTEEEHLIALQGQPAPVSAQTTQSPSTAVSHSSPNNV